MAAVYNESFMHEVVYVG